ncbi:MAG: outer membrane beta-barrel protein [Bacteroidetes bacterium]|nr:outer membrane beta-barrel protein [Bacteroidota bacterium]
MRKSISIFAFILVTAFTVNAQKSNEKASLFSIGAEAGLPIGGFGDFWGLGFGASAKLALPLKHGFAITASAGYISFDGKTYLGTKLPSFGTIPLKAGLKYNIAGRAFYLEPQIGYTIGNVTGSSSSDVSGFSGAFGIGYSFSRLIDLGIRYESYKKTVDAEGANIIGVRFGFNF